ncbi:oligosaccharide flippase family protein [Candidatus Pacearchaeota archaeon]|nr:oligosaccharide flippase family protein [Candidatus Pacearchaeota archaeon]
MMKSIGFLLIPLYTRLLTPSDYGILAVVTAITSLLGVFYMLGLPASSNRFYFEDPQNEKYVKELWGTNISFILIISFSFTTLLLLTGDRLFQSFIGEIAFYPYIVLGLITITTIPFFNMYQQTLKTKQLGGKFGTQNIARFLFNLGFILLFVVVLRMKAEGPLLAGAITGVIFFIYTAVTFGKYIKWGINFKILKKNLSYGLPLVLHGLAGWITTLLDRIFLNTFRSVAEVGLYTIGYSFGIVLNLVTAGFNEAFSPYFMKCMKENNKQDLKQISKLSLIVIGIYVILAIFISIFSKDVIRFMATESYYSGWQVAPFIAFSSVMQGMYRILAAPLFFNLGGTKFISLGTFVSSGLSIAFLIYLIPKYGIIGAGFSSLLTNVIIVFLIGIIAHKIEPFEWNYKKMGLIIFMGLCVSFSIIYMESKGMFFNYLPFKIITGILTSVTILIISNNGLIGLKSNIKLIRKLAIRKGETDGK